MEGVNSIHDLEALQLTSNKSSCVINAIHKGTEAPKISKIKVDQGGSKDYFDDSVSVDENGVAYNSEKNAIRLLELILACSLLVELENSCGRKKCLLSSCSME